MSHKIIIPFSLLFTGLLMWSGCKQEGLEPTNCRDGRCTYAFSEGQAIQIDRDTINQSAFVQIVNGSKRVFDYEFVRDEEPLIADDEYTERIYFEIEENLSEFKYTDGKLADIQLVVIPYCFCPQAVFEPRSGIVSGKKINDTTWKIDIDISLDFYGTTETRQISATFEKK